MTGRGAGVRLTARGTAVLTTGVVLVLAAALFGIQELYALAAAAWVLVAASGLWVARVRWDLRSARSLTPARVPVGTEALVELAVRNAGRRPSPVVGLRDRVDHDRSSITLTIGPLAPQETVRTRYRVPTSARGVHQVGPLDVELADPFGLTVRSRRAAPPSPLIVHPRVVDLGPAQRSIGVEIGAGESWAAARSTGADLASVREYRTGDDLRRVHWASTARLDELMVRQDEAPTDGQMTVAVDLRCAAWADGGLEVALSAAASVLVASMDEGVDANLVLSTGQATEHGTGSPHLAAALDLLAGVEPSPGPRQVEQLLRAMAEGPTVVITSATDEGARLVASRPVRGGVPLTAVLVTSEAGGRGPLPKPGSRTRVLAIDSVEALVARWRPGREAWT